MKRAAVSSILVAVVLLAIAVLAQAQQPTKVPRIGYLSGSSISANPPWREAFLVPGRPNFHKTRSAPSFIS